MSRGDKCAECGGRILTTKGVDGSDMVVDYPPSETRIVISANGARRVHFYTEHLLTCRREKTE